MKADRWRQVEELFDAAVELPAAEREEFLRDACGGDEELRRELASLLDARGQVGDFLEAPALEVAAREFARGQPEPSRAQSQAAQTTFAGRVGPYRVERLLGAGGMGEVYLARDEKLGRRVALKLLPRKFVSDPDRRARFEREARAASALNHPNLITVYDIGEVEGSHYIATEFVEGKTVRALIKEGLKTKDALNIAAQVAEALSAAHGAGIVHRDIKPENIMVRPDGYVKVLDFGLAKLTEAAEDAPPAMQTQAGLIMGTPAYMSPEQAAGDAVDGRTDVWSLGVVLYEMATGGSPFKGGSRQETLNAILSKEPAPATEVNPSLPLELNHILSKALEKDRELRYQTASDFRADLRRLRRELDSSASLPGHSTQAAAGRRTRPTAAPARPWRGFALGATVVAALALCVWLLAARWPRAKAPAGPDWSRATNVQLTVQQGPEAFLSLAPDGKSFVYVTGPKGNADIYWQRVGGKNPTNLTAGSTKDDTTPAFSPDGNLIAFHSEREPPGLYVMGATGENPRRVSDAGFHPSWSPDGKEIVAGAEWVGVHTNKAAGPSPLWVVSVATGERRLLTAGDAAQPSWSPAGHRIAYWFWSREGRGDIATVPASGGEPVVLTRENSTDWNPAWSPDGRFVYFSSDRGGSMNLWRTPVDERTGEALGAAEPVATPSRYAYSPSFSRDGRLLAYVRYESQSHLQSLPFDDVRGRVTGEPVNVTRGAWEVSTPQLAPGGERYVVRWPRVVQDDIAVFDRDGSNWRALTDDKFSDRRPRWFPDGRRIAFTSDRGGAPQIWAINADGTGLRQLTYAAEKGAGGAVLSPDGRRLAYTQAKERGGAAFLLDLTRGWREQEPEPLPPVPGFAGYLSPYDWSADGDRLIGVLVGEERGESGIATFSFSTRAYERITNFGEYPGWLKDGRRFVFAHENRVYLGDARSKKTRELFAPPLHAIQNPAVSPDNRAIYFRFLQVEADVWLLALD
jgi:Tol biopolymer transport system component